METVKNRTSNQKIDLKKLLKIQYIWTKKWKIEEKKEYNIGEYLHYPGIRKYILKKTQTTLTLKEKPEKLYYIKLGTSIYHKTPLRE